MIKYGVITVDQLCKDLIEWETLYCSGRMHKPVRVFSSLRTRSCRRARARATVFRLHPKHLRRSC